MPMAENRTVGIRVVMSRPALSAAFPGKRYSGVRTDPYLDDQAAALGVRARTCPARPVVNALATPHQTQYLPDAKIRGRTAPWPRPSPASPIALALVRFENREDDRKPARTGF